MGKIGNEKAKCDEYLNELKCNEFRNNLLFFKIAENSSETDESRKDAIVKVIHDDMLVQNAKEIPFTSVERMGKPNTGKTRPILVKFENVADREKVRRSCGNLKGKPIGVSQQFPKEIQEKRKLLIPELKKARSEGKRAFLKMGKLIIVDQDQQKGVNA
ncbi:uncharacterized protein LOC132720031 [Ruditapes philippinarum]|uniref:uncharacterized protein LOC132720031 n=1 Tax=Ruditapes philippinarum TaxID=129788 RepID=UPI00295ADAD7|nr:uncharacterized protein LOC132720031 [Ruditapes philippinarum]